MENFYAEIEVEQAEECVSGKCSNLAERKAHQSPNSQRALVCGLMFQIVKIARVSTVRGLGAASC